jgi:polar amino acid transport system substrate-binding protein
MMHTARFAIALAAALICLPGASAQTDEPTATVATAPAPTSTLERIRSSGRLTLGYLTDARPMSYRDTSGNPAGYSVALCQRIADSLKAQLELPSLTVDWRALVSLADAGVGQGSVDVLCTAEAITQLRRAEVDFSIPVFPGGIAALLRSDASETLTRVLEQRPPPYQVLWRGSTPQRLQALQQRTYAVVSGSLAVDWLAERIKTFRGSATMNVVDSFDAGVQQVANRGADVLFGDRARLLYEASHGPAAAGLQVLSRHFTYRSAALALARDNDDFRLMVDKALTSIYANPAFGDLYASQFGAPDDDTVQFFRTIAVPEK